MSRDIVTPSPWQDWRSATPARLALGRAGSGMPTDEVLRFGWAHAQARDAIHAALDVDALEADLQADGWQVARVHSQAADRETYLRRPDLGRQLREEDAVVLAAFRGDGSPHPEACDLAIVIGDGLSSLAVARHAVPLLSALRPLLAEGTRIAPVVVATQARVALGDAVGEALGAKLLVMLIGERPGLSSPDSLGIYLTHAPRRGLHDAERNCISNVRPEGLSPSAAALKLAWLLREAARRQLTGVALKDESDAVLHLREEDAGQRLDSRPSQETEP
ncbi:Ethanolamine ammonia-lyase light chain [Burkholderiales bacterium 8X]|nr:Ethanolamine ammonia-lyase light chain [Burkholderiales bacterium 8X]